MDKKPVKHWGILTQNKSDKDSLVQELLEGKNALFFPNLQGLKGALFSKLELERFIEEEERHGSKILTESNTQALLSMSSGEQKKVLIKHILNANPDFLIIDNPFDNLDTDAQRELRQQLESLSPKVSIIQFTSRKNELLSFINTFARLEENSLQHMDTLEAFLHADHGSEVYFGGTIPPPPSPVSLINKVLFSFNKVTVAYGDKTIVRDIAWEVKSGEFWQLKGKNGSGKTTLLTMITGDNPKAYGQELHIFGHKKGSGESVWELKKNIGYFTPSMTDKFTGYHTVEFMLLSGFFDSVGLYATPTEIQFRIAKAWLKLIAMWEIKDHLFHDLSMGQKRLLMITRAMIKHPALLILDEPTAGLDDESAALFIALVNKMAKESTTGIIFVSHREEVGLTPDFIFELQSTENGSIGKVIKQKREVD